MQRRKFLARTAAGLPFLLTRSAGQSTTSRVEILTREPIGRITPDIYGHFVEHLGAVVYDGIWVGEGSKIPNTNGIRNDVVNALKRVKPSVIRWPGGCFADSYDWRDGTGPRAQRPRRTNFWVDSREWAPNANRKGPQVYDPNHFGSADFARFCRMTGSQPYFAANLRSLPAQDFWHWVEYCNSPAGSTTWADRRAADGEREPLNVRYWGVGNESWGCGGNFSPEDYAIEFKRYSAWVPSYGVNLALVGSGPNGAEYEWTRRFFQKAQERGGLGKMWGWGLHHYSWNVSGGKTNDWVAGKGDALQFTPEEHNELLNHSLQMDALIVNHWAAMGDVDRARRIKLIVDEWGSWHRPGTDPFPEALLGQQNTMRDALLAGMTLNIFHKHADKVAMANIAQLVNCLQSLFLAHEDKFCLTPTYHVFDLYADHQGAESLRTVTSCPQPVEWLRANGQPGRMEGLSASASIRDKQITATLVNPSYDKPLDVLVAAPGVKITAATARQLAGKAQAHNTWSAPRNVEIAPANATVTADGVRCTMPACSVLKLTMQTA